MSQLAEIIVDEGYAAAKSGCAYYLVPNPGTLMISGATRADYLQRQTTNDLGLLSATRALPNILTNASGRILEVFTLLRLGDQIALLSQPGHAQGLAGYFKKNLFFNDQVTIEDVSANWRRLEFRGPQAVHLLAQLGLTAAPFLDEVATFAMGSDTVHVIGIDSFNKYPAFILLVPGSLTDQLINQLTDLGAISLSVATRDLLRIEAGIAGDPEFTDANTPYEIGLARYLSESKGCYTGQEVLARQVTYDKIVRSLVQLSANEPITAGTAISTEGKNVGQVSSAAISPSLGPLALAVLRKPHEVAGTQVQVGTIIANVT